MAKKHPEGYLSAKESRRISRENRKITGKYEKQYKRKNVPEQEYLTQMHNPENAVEFDNLHTYFFTDVGTVKSVDGVSFEVPIGKTVGVVGESGCGKSVTSLSLMQLLQRPQGQIVDGQIRLNLGDKAYDIAKTPMEKMEKLRGNYMSMIFQEPMTALNPVFRIGEQVDEITKLHNPDMSKEQVKANIDYYMQNASTMKEGLEAAGLKVYGGVNAPYLWLKTPDGISSWRFFEQMLYEANVVGTPGVGFGPSGEGFIRLTAFGRHDDCVEAMKRIRKWMA